MSDECATDVLLLPLMLARAAEQNDPRSGEHFTRFVRVWLPADDAAAAAVLLRSRALEDTAVANNHVLLHDLITFILARHTRTRSDGPWYVVRRGRKRELRQVMIETML